MEIEVNINKKLSEKDIDKIIDSHYGLLEFRPKRTIKELTEDLEKLREDLFAELEKFAGYLAKYLTVNKRPNRKAVDNAMNYINTIRQRVLCSNKLRKKDQLIILLTQKYEFKRLVVDLLNKNSIDIDQLADIRFFAGR